MTEGGRILRSTSQIDMQETEEDEMEDLYIMEDEFEETTLGLGGGALLGVVGGTPGVNAMFKKVHINIDF